jgi:hypothetical protein
MALGLAAAGAGLLVGCASTHHPGPAAEKPHSDASVLGVGYDDRQIAKIQRGETGEAQLLEWFGMPDSREVKPDGQAHLSWSFSRRTDGGRGRSGVLNVSLAANGKVEAYAARGGTLSEKRSVEFVEKSDTDLREHMKQWQEEGWNVLNVSARLPQPDGTVHRKAELSRSNGTAASGFGYDDRRIGGIRRGETTSTQLVEWFGPPYSRNLQPDGRAQLAWSFASRTDGGPGHSGELNASLAPDGKVDAYSARRGPE